MDSFQNTTLEIPEEALKQVLENEESATSRFLTFAKRQPFLMAGILGFTAIGGIGIYKWKTRTIPTQLFLIQLRVAAQGTAVGCLGLGMMYHMYKDYISDKPNK